MWFLAGCEVAGSSQATRHFQKINFEWTKCWCSTKGKNEKCLALVFLTCPYFYTLLLARSNIKFVYSITELITFITAFSHFLKATTKHISSHLQTYGLLWFWWYTMQTIVYIVIVVYVVDVSCHVKRGTRRCSKILRWEGCKVKEKWKVIIDFY